MQSNRTLDEKYEKLNGEWFQAMIMKIDELLVKTCPLYFSRY